MRRGLQETFRLEMAANPALGGKFFATFFGLLGILSFRRDAGIRGSRARAAVARLTGRKGDERRPPGGRERLGFVACRPLGPRFRKLHSSCANIL